MKCPACGEANVDQARFCAFCGAKMDEQRHMPTIQPSPAEEPSEPQTAKPAAQYARPLSDNPIQPVRRSMPHLYSEPVSRTTATADYTPVQPSAPAPKPVPEAKPTVKPVPEAKSAANPAKVFLFDEEIEEEEKARRKAEDKKRREEFKKQHSAPDDELFYDEDDLEYGEEFEDEDPQGGRIFIKIISALTLLALIAAIVGVLYATPLGGRLRAQWGISSNYEDYLALAKWEQARGSMDSAANSYLNALKLNDSDYDVCMEIATGFEACGDRAHAEKMYVFLIDHYPTADEPYERLMVMLYNQGRLEAYEELIKKRAQAQPDYVAQTVFTPPVPSLESGDYTRPISLEFFAENALAIYFTLDGNPATTASMPYTGAITITSGSYEIHAIAVYENGSQSMEWIGTYNVRK